MGKVEGAGDEEELVGAADLELVEDDVEAAEEVRLDGEGAEEEAEDAGAAAAVGVADLVGRCRVQAAGIEYDDLEAGNKNVQKGFQPCFSCLTLLINSIQFKKGFHDK